MGGMGSAPEGSIAGRRKALDAKFAQDAGEGSGDEEEPADYDALAAKIAEAGGTIVMADEVGARALKKTRRADNGPNSAKEASAAVISPPAGAGVAAASAVAVDVELVQVDAQGRPKVKFVAVDAAKVAERRAKAGAGTAARSGGPAVRNATLLSFGDDGEEG